MNQSTRAILLLLVVALTETIHRSFAFSFSHTLHRKVQLHATTLANNDAAVVVTGPDGKAALNFDDDLRLTLQIIMDHQLRSTTVSTEQLVQQVTAAAAIVEVEDNVVDLSIPYNAAAQLAYDNESSTIKSSTTFEAYKMQYETKAIADVIAKKGISLGAIAVSTKEAVASNEIDISIPYDAAAKLAYGALSSEERTNTDYNTFQQTYVERAVADVIFKKASKNTAAAAPASSSPSTSSTSNNDDVGIPYDAAAQLAFGQLSSIKHSLSYEQFKQQYEMNAIMNVMNKKLKREQQA